MSDFESALNDFLTGQLNFAGLETALLTQLHNNPAAAPEIARMIESTYRAGRLPRQLYSVLNTRLAQPVSAVPAASSLEDIDKTRIPAPSWTPPPVDDNAHTVVHQRPPIPPTTEVTRVSTTPSIPPADVTRVVHTPPTAPETTLHRAATTTSETGAHPIKITTPPVTSEPISTSASPDTTTPPATTKPPVVNVPPTITTDSTHTTIAPNTRPGTVTTGMAQTSPTSGTTGSYSGWTDMLQAATQASETLQVGSVLKDRFVFEELIGHGGMGEVYKARDLRKEEAQDRNPFVAVKILNESFKSHPESLRALQRESRKAQNLAHPNIVNVFDFDRDGGNVYMTMEFMEGEPLDALIKRIRGQGLEQAKALPLIMDMGHALAYAHKNSVVHSDFKPGNAFLTRDGVVKVFDFGIARATKVAGQSGGEKTLFDAGELGALTPAYASYEMLEGDEPDPRDDVYALACVAYELLTGRHPFNKLPANKAKLSGLIPAPVKGLSRRQWKGFQHGLAFERKDRCPDVETFLAEITRKQVSKSLIAGLAAGILLLMVLIGFWLPDYLHKRRIATIIEVLKSRDTTAINEALVEVQALQEDDREQVVQDAKSELVSWYQAQIDAAIDETQGHYDYPEAQRIAEAALALYPDSVSIQRLKERVESRKDQLLNELNTRYNQHLIAGHLLPSAEDDINDVLTTLAQVQPNHPLLSDPRLSVAYGQQATRLFESGALEAAQVMVSAGLARYPDDVNLVNLRDRISSEQLRSQRAERITELEQQLESGLASLNSLETVAGLREPVRELRNLKADSTVLSRINDKVGKLLDEQLDHRITQRDWDAARTLLEGYADLLPSSGLQAGKQRIADAEKAFLQHIDSLYAALLDAIAKRQLDATAEDSAAQRLAALETAGADAALLDQGRAAIGQAFLELAREARAAKHWETARSYVEQGLQSQPGESLSASLQQETTEISRAQEAAQQQLAQADREAQEHMRQAKIQQLYDSFEQSLKVASFDAAAGNRSMRILEQLAGVNPADPLIARGRTRVAGQLVQQITALSDQGQWKQALSLAGDAVKVIPGSELLSKTRLDIERGQAQQLAMEQERRLDQYKQSLASLLQLSVIDAKWEKELHSDLLALAELLPKDDPWLTSQDKLIAKHYLDQARAMREAQRFSEANSLLERGAKFAPRDTAFTQEKEAVAKAETVFEKTNKEKQRIARIEGNKQTLLTQAKANDVRRANETLQVLRDELPKDDSFLLTTAPRALGGAYLRLAEGAARKKNFDTALKLLRAGIEIAPDMVELQSAKTDYEYEFRVDQKSGQYASANSLNTEREKQALAELAAVDKKRYSDVKNALAGTLYQRVRTLAKQNQKLAEGLLASARQLFPDDKRLATLKISPPVVSAPSVKETPKVVVEPPPKKTQPAPVPVQTVRSQLDNCKPTLAGYGRRSRGVCYDGLSGDNKGPLLVVIPAGGGISRPYAISKHEISVSDYNQYCRLSGQCAGIKGESGDLPVTGISIKQAKAYAAWMSKSSGYVYRLPTEQEWTYAADAQGKQPVKDFNCRVLLGNQVIKGMALGSVKMGKPNGWGLKNYIGNAQEWAITPAGVVAKGGAYSDSLSNCSITLSKVHNGDPDQITGFRLVRDLKVGG